MQRGLRLMTTVRGDKFADVEVGEHITICHDERGVDTRLIGSELDGPTCVEWRWFNGIRELHIAAPAVRKRSHEGFRFEPEREHDLGDPATTKSVNESLDHRPVADGQHRLWDLVGEWPESCSEAADENDGAHQPSVWLAPAVIVGASSPGTVVPPKS